MNLSMLIYLLYILRTNLAFEINAMINTVIECHFANNFKTFDRRPCIMNK